jgi:hypothetical protein
LPAAAAAAVPANAIAAFASGLAATAAGAAAEVDCVVSCSCTLQLLVLLRPPASFASAAGAMALQVRLAMMPACWTGCLHAGRLACMDSPLGVPGELERALLVKHCMKV